MEKVLHRLEYGHGKMSDIDLLVDVSKKIEGNTICPLGDAAAWPVAEVGHVDPAAFAVVAVGKPVAAASDPAIVVAAAACPS